jgi:hypothetical protein
VLDKSGSVARVEREYARAQRGTMLWNVAARFASLVEAMSPRRTEAAEGL